MTREGMMGWVAMGWLVACAPVAPVADDAPVLDAAGLACTATPTEIREACGRPLGPVATECSPDGEGWCCPFGAPSSSLCGCTSGTGGFVRSPCECATHTICDLPPPGWGMTLDEHGCPTLQILPTTACCICPPDADPGDAGVPSEIDAP